jgi:hypothetical protein
MDRTRNVSPLFCPLRKIALNESRAIFFVRLRASPEKYLADLSHAPPLFRGYSLQFFLEIGRYPKRELSVFFHSRCLHPCGV